MIQLVRQGDEENSMDTHIEKSMPYSVHAVANEILRQARDMELDITHLKLQKLVYLAHALHLAIKKTPLIAEDVQAWKYGPVIKELYDSCSKYGSEPITDNLSLKKESGKKVVNVKPVVSRNQAIENLVNAVLKRYGHLDGGQLISLTHEKGSAWSVLEEYHKGGAVRDSVIPVELIGEAEGKHLLSEEYLSRV